MNCLIATLIFFSLLGTSAYATPPRGKGGRSECIGLAVQAALTAYAELSTIPSSTFPPITVQPSTGSPSNGIDVTVIISGKVYDVIAIPEPANTALTGCSSASVASVH